MRRLIAAAVLGMIVLCCAPYDRAADQPAGSSIEADILKHLDALQPELITVNQDIWTFAEVGLEEHRSSARLIGVLKKAGFKVTEGVAVMPTAFVAEYGSGSPVIGILAEYDALPELSQEATGSRKPAAGRSTGHGCGHCALGTASIGAALAIKEVYDKHKLKGTIRIYGTPAEETLIGKVYMLLAGLFRDLDACLHWHPGTKNRTYFSTSKAAVSAKFTFHGLAAHASGSPDKGRSALDGVELMNVGANVYARTRQGFEPHPLRHHQRRRAAERRAGDGAGLVLRAGQRSRRCREELRLAARHRGRRREDEPHEGHDADRHRLP